MQASVGEAQTDTFDIDTRECARFFKRQHVGSGATHRTVGAELPRDNSLVFKDRDFESSFSRKHDGGGTIGASKASDFGADGNP